MQIIGRESIRQMFTQVHRQPNMAIKQIMELLRVRRVKL